MALYELNIPSERDVDDLTWREFQLKLMGYRRRQLDEWERTRVLTHMMYMNIPEKGTKKSIDQFWPMNGESKSKLKDYQKELIVNAQKAAVEEARQKKLQNG